MGTAVFGANNICGTIQQGEQLQYDSFQVTCNPAVSGRYVLLQRLERGLLEVEEIDIIEERVIQDGGCLQYG